MTAAHNSFLVYIFGISVTDCGEDFLNRCQIGSESNRRRARRFDSDRDELVQLRINQR
jgi:hypothetical protein